MTDSDYVLKALAGDREAYGRLVEAYQARVFAIALSITGNYSDSQDITQEIFLRAYLKLRTLSKPSNFGKWLYTISKRLSISFLRKRNRIFRAATDPNALKQVHSDIVSGAEAYARKEFSSLVQKQVNTLPQKLREAILLFYMEGFTIKDAASFLGISESAMKKRLYYGRTKIRENLTEKIEAELREYRPSEKTRNTVLAALPAGGVPKIGILGSLATKGGLTMAAISAKKVAIVVGIIIVGTITTVTIHRNLPKSPSPTPPIVSEKKDNDNDRVVKKKAATKLPKHKYQAPAESKSTWNISGKVQNDQDNLISGAEIKAYDSSDTGNIISTVNSDEYGLFTIENLKPNHQYDIIAEHQDYFPKKIENIGTSTSELVITFKAGATITGKVVDYFENPVANATVHLFEGEGRRGYQFTFGGERNDLDEKNLLLLRTVTSDSEGKFAIRNVFPNVPEKMYRLRARAEGYIDSNKARVRVASITETPRPYKLMLRHPSIISGIVIDEDENPVEGARLFIHQHVRKEMIDRGWPPERLKGQELEAYAESEHNKSLSAWDLIIEGLSKNRAFITNDTTDSQGHFTVMLSGRGYYELSAFHENYGPSEPFATNIEGGDQHDSIIFVLSNEKPLITGLVEDENGAVEDVEVVLEWKLTSMQKAESAKTDENGEFEFQPLFHTSYIAKIKDEQYGEYKSPKLVIDADNLYRHLDIALHKALTIEGDVYLREGVPLSFPKTDGQWGSISLRETPGSSRGYSSELNGKFYIDTNGHFTLKNLAPGNYSFPMIVRYEGNEYATHFEEVAAGTTDLKVVLTSGMATVKGMLVDGQTNIPVPSGQMTLLTSKSRILVLGDGHSIKKSFSSVDGSFEFTDIPEEKYYISISTVGYSTKGLGEYSIRDGEVVDLGTVKLFHPYPFKGKIVSAIDGAPVEEAEIKGGSSILESAHREALAVSAEDGTFILPQVSKKNLYFMVFHPDYAPKLAEINVDESAALIEHIIKMDPPYAGTLSGTVLRFDGSPMPNVRISMYHRPQNLRATTDTEGQYFFDELGPGRWALFCSYIRREIEIADGQDATQDFTFQKGYKFSGKITDPSFGKEEINIYIRRKTDPTVEESIIIISKADSSGAFSVSNVPPGRYSVRFTVGYAMQETYYHSIYLDMPDHDIELNIETNNSFFSGRLINWKGKFPKAKWLYLQHFDIPGYQPGTLLSDDGTFSFGKIAPGKYNFYLNQSIYNTTEVLIQQIEIPEGKDLTDVTITVPQ